MLKFLIRGESVLEERLAQIGKMVDPQSRVADIGTDHAYLPKIGRASCRERVWTWV